MIPDEAVEAAAKYLYLYLNEDHRGAPPAWGSLTEDDEDKVECRHAARELLEAAAPHLMAAALDDAATIFQGRLPDGTGNGRAYNSYQVADMLRARAAATRNP